MKVIRRQQVTNIQIKRQVSHELELNGKKYVRYETVNVNVPYMDTDIILNKSRVIWQVYTGENLVRNLTKLEVKTLMLEQHFGKIDIDSRNGN